MLRASGFVATSLFRGIIRTRSVQFHLATPFIFALAALLLPTPARADTLSIQEFNRLEPRWDSFAEVELPITVEGRYSSVSRTGIRFRNCNLPFRAAPGKELIKPTGSTGTVEATGHLTRDNGKFVFIVERLREVPSDSDQLRVRQVRLPADKPDPWYALAGWAKTRAEFYDDKALTAEAKELDVKGLTIERNQLKDDDADGRLALAGKAAKLELSEALQLELTHEAYHLRWNRRGQENGLARDELAERLLRDLPGTRVPLDPPQPELAAAYLKDPLTTYRDADLPKRRTLHRILYIETVREIIEQDAKPDGSNGDEIAAALEKRTPELKGLAESYRDRALDYELARVGTLTRDEMLALQKKFTNREQPEKAAETASKWLDIRKSRLRDDDLAGLIHLASEHVKLRNDPIAARDLLLKAWRRDPKSEDAAAQLRRLGYRLQNGEWITEAEMQALPADPIQKAIREGRVAAGMSPAQVRKTLGAPTAVTRVATRNAINEVWTYEQPGTSKLAVHFLRRLGRESTGTVVTVTPVAPR